MTAFTSRAGSLFYLAIGVLERNVKASCICAILFFFHIIISQAQVKLNSLFSDNMVLQKGVVVPVWGTASRDEMITVKFNGQVSTTHSSAGKWMVALRPLPYITEPSTLEVFASDTIRIQNVLVGEVWLCSGQSNMERQLGPRPPQPLITDWEKERDAANYPMIREFYVPQNYSAEKISDVNGNWTICSPQTVADFSAVGYFFARNLHNNLKIPVGIIFSAFGGTPAEDWISREALESNPKLASLITNYNKDTGWKPPGKVMNGLYNGMIYPLLPYKIQGVAWYQGESNNDRPQEYISVLSTMINKWRHDFARAELPFLIVQIAPHHEMTPEIREAQFIVSQTVPNTALIVTTDCGDSLDIHPPLKQPVGERLSLAARALAYQQKIEYSGPLYQSCKIKKNKVILTFSHSGGKLIAKGKTLQGFSIAGANQKFIPGNAGIKGKKVVVTADLVRKPVAVRYGWENVPDGNLYNDHNLPASPFRTDVK
jgi:sialate O-acetylesterase